MHETRSDSHFCTRVSSPCTADCELPQYVCMCVCSFNSILTYCNFEIDSTLWIKAAILLLVICSGGRAESKTGHQHEIDSQIVHRIYSIEQQNKQIQIGSDCACRDFTRFLYFLSFYKLFNGFRMSVARIITRVKSIFGWLAHIDMSGWIQLNGEKEWEYANWIEWMNDAALSVFHQLPQHIRFLFVFWLPHHSTDWILVNLSE